MKTLPILKIALVTMIMGIFLNLKEKLAKYQGIGGRLKSSLIRVGESFKKVKKIKPERKTKLIILILVVVNTLLAVKIFSLVSVEIAGIEGYIKKADDLHETGKYKKARKVYVEIIERFPHEKSTEWAHYRIANCQQKLGLFHRAIYLYQNFLEEYPESSYLPQVQYNLAWSLGKTGHLDKASQILRKAIDNFPRTPLTPDFYLLLGDFLVEQKISREAISVYQKITRRYPQSPQAGETYLKLGDTYWEEQHYSEAIIYYSSLLKHSSSSEIQARVLFSLARCYLSSGEIDRALSLFRLLRKRFPQSIHSRESLILTARDLYQKGDYEKSLEIFHKTEKICQKEPNLLARIRREMAQVYLAQKNYQKAIETYEEIIREESYPRDEAHIYFQVGNLYKEMGDYQKASIFFQKFIKYFSLSEDITSAYLNLGECLFQQGLYLKAMRPLRELLKKKPPPQMSGKSFRLIGEGYMRMGLWEEALISFKQSLSYLDRRETAGVRVKIGECYLRQGDFPSAKKIFSLLLKSPPDDLPFQTYIYAGDLLAAQEEKKLALDIYREAVDRSLRPEERLPALYRVARMEQALNLIPSAVETYQTMIDLNSSPDSIPQREAREDAFIRLADIYYSLRDYRRASLLYKQVVKEYPQSKDIPWAIYQVGNCYRHSGPLEKAKVAYRELTENFRHSFWSELAEVMTDIASLPSATQ